MVMEGVASTKRNRGGDMRNYWRHERKIVGESYAPGELRIL